MNLARGVRGIIIGILLAAFILIPISSVSAQSYGWYSQSNPSPGYLATPGNNAGGLKYMLDNAISSDLDVTEAGEYCNYYNTNTALIHQNSFNQSSITGFDPGGTRSDWQQGDQNSYNVCQAREGTWGFKVTGGANNNCNGSIKPAPCGIHQYVRLSNGQGNRPWSTSFGTHPAPALTFSTNVKAQSANYTGGVFGYLCPHLQDIASGNYIEYCFVEWQKGSGFPGILQYDTLGHCATTPSGKNVDTIYTAFHSGMNWSTQRPGSADTFGAVPNYVYMSASISAQNLSNVITRLNLAPPEGCSRGFSTNISNYALTGFEHGVEGGNFSSLGGSVSNVKFETTTDTLFTGDRLNPGEIMYSSNGQYRLVMQADGNLVTYNSSNVAIWSSQTSGNLNSYVVMQSDGNLVIYNPSNVAIWNRPSSYIAGSYATIQNDGNFVVYKGSQSKWSSW